MYKPTNMELAAIIVIGFGTVLALAFTDFGLWAGLVGISCMLAEYRLVARKPTRTSK